MGKEMNSRDSILSKLRDRGRPFPDVLPPQDYQPMTPLVGDEAVLLARFISEAQALNCMVHQCSNNVEVIGEILSIIAADPAVSAWDLGAIPLPGLQAALDAAQISIAQPNDSTVRVGISGASAALAATGSVVLCSGDGRFRATSLLPPVHIVVLTQDQILPNLEGWVHQQRARGLPAFKQVSNTVIISGPSRTADIAMELILGMHGPGELHLFILPKPVS
jgi:L-lactate utilization protein LutC